MSNAKHSEQSQTEGIHTPYRWTWANAAARTAQTGVTAADVTNAATGLQLDTNVVYRATDEDPLTWQAINSTASGDVTGPGSSTDEAIVRFDGTTGKLLQNSAATIDDEGKLTVTQSDAGTSDIQPVAEFRRNSGGTPLDGFGASVVFGLETSTTVSIPMAELQVILAEATHADRRTDIVLYGYFGSEKVPAFRFTMPDYSDAEPDVDADPRGIYSLDMQPLHQLADEVASGYGSLILWGESNKAVGLYSSVINSFNSYANSDRSFVLGGQKGLTTLFGELALNPVVHNSQGAHPSLLTGGVETLDATPVEAGLGSISSVPTQFITLANNMAYAFTAWLIARAPVSGDCAMYRLDGGIKRLANAASTALIGTVDKIAKEDAGAAAWDVAATADTTNGRLVITVTGDTAETVYWEMAVLLVKLT